MSAPTRTPGEVLTAARREDSLRKRQRTLTELERMVAEGEPVTFAALARAAHVSTWLVYSEGIRDHVTAAIERQERAPVRHASAGRTASQASVKLDLEMARAEIADLRQERDRLRSAVRHQLGHQLDQVGHRTLVERIDELTEQARRREQSEAAARAEADRLRDQVRELEAELAGARTSLRNVLRDINRPEMSERPSYAPSVARAGAGEQPECPARPTVVPLRARAPREEKDHS